MRRIVHRHRQLLVIVLIVDEDCILAFEPEGQSPVPADPHRPLVLEFSSQRMEPPPWSIHVARPLGIVEGKQLHAELDGVLRLNPCLRPGAKELLQSPMAEVLYHCV